MPHRTLMKCFEDISSVKSKQSHVCLLLLQHWGEKPPKCFTLTVKPVHFLPQTLFKRPVLTEAAAARTHIPPYSLSWEPWRQNPPLWLLNHSDHSPLRPAGPEVWDYSGYGYELASGECYLPTHVATRPWCMWVRVTLSFIVDILSTCLWWMSRSGNGLGKGYESTKVKWAMLLGSHGSPQLLSEEEC